MKTIGLEQILFLIVFIALPLLNLLFQRVRRHFEADPPEGESMPDTAQGTQEIPQQLREPRMARKRLHDIQAPAVS